MSDQAHFRHLYRNTLTSFNVSITRLTASRSTDRSDITYGLSVEFKTLTLRKNTPSLRAEVVLDDSDEDKPYTLGDTISGSVKLTASHNHDADIFNAQITLEGTTFVEIQRAGMGSPRDIGNTSIKQTFLKLGQHGPKTLSKTVTFLAKGQTKLLPFEFTIPFHVEGVCSHPIDNEGVRKQHQILPPCISVRGPETVVVQYHINFVAQTRNLHKSTTAKTVFARQPINVVPTQLTVTWPIRLPSEARITKVRLKDRFKMSAFGRLQILSHHGIQILRDTRETKSISSEGVIVGLIINFISKSEADPPQILSIRRSLITHTFMSTVPWQDYPTKYPGLALSKHRGIRQEITRLSELKLSDVRWKATTVEELEKGPSQEGIVHSCQLSIPLVPTADMYTVPTFYSCLISREYTVKFSLRLYSVKMGHSSVSFEVPVQVVHVKGYEKHCALLSE